MIIITEAKILEVKENFTVIRHAENVCVRVRKNGSPRTSLENLEVIEEAINGRKFTRADGTSLYVGFSKQVEDILGIYYASWEDMESRIQTLHRTNQRVHKSLERLSKEHEHLEFKIKNLSFWRRLKYLINWPGAIN